MIEKIPECVEIDKKYFGHPFTVYRTLKTRQYDEKFGDPKILSDKDRKISNLWNLMGDIRISESLTTLLYLNGELGYFAAVSKEDFMSDGVPDWGFPACLNHKKLGAEKIILNEVEIEVVSLSEQVLEKLVNIPLRL
jgi:hypothetical protein